MSELDKILAPIAGSNPSGVDLEYDSRFQAVKNLIETGNPEEPAYWKKVKKETLELLNDGRSIELLVLLAVSLVATEGFSGLSDGLRILCKSVEEFWENIFPELDMEEPEPDRYEIRLNVLAQLGENPGKLGDKLCFVEKILRAPLSISNPRMNICFWPVWENERTEVEDNTDLNTALSYIGQMPPEDSQSISKSVNESIDHLTKLNEFLMEKTGSAYNAPFDDSLLPTLKQISSKIVASDESQEAGEGMVAQEGGDVSMNPNANTGMAAPAAPPPPPPGTINSREDVKEALGKIIDYYKKNEPSSPIPYLATRTQELVDAEFMDIIRNLSKESEPQFKKTLNIT